MKNWFEDKKLLVPFDFSTESAQAIDTALNMASKPNNVYAIHVAPDMTVSSPEVVWQTLSEGTRKRNIEQSFQKQFSTNQYKDLHFDVSFGDPGQGIADYAEQIGANVIVMPSQGKTGIKRLLIGSVAERVGRMAHCPVILLRK